MARAKVKVAKQDLETKLEFGQQAGVGPDGVPFREPGVRRVPHHEPRRLITIEPEGLRTGESLRLRGAYVRVRTALDATDADVERVRAEVVAAGALAVRVMPRSKQQVIADKAKEPAKPRETLRQACVACMGAVVSKDPAALSRLVEATLNRVGL